jgi:type VI secretion system secreted protein Hcp
MQRSARARMACHLALAVSLVVGLVALLPVDADALTAGSYFLKIPGIEGDSQDANHVGEIVLMSFSLDFAQRRCGDLRVVKNIDKASPKLMLNAVLGTVFPTVVLTGTTAGESSQDFLTLTLTNATITAVNLADTTGDPPAVEAVTFTEQRLEVAFRPQNSDGSLGEPIKVMMMCR